MIRRLLANPVAVVLTTFAWTAASIFWSVHQHDWGWFQRSGAFMTVAGVMLAGRGMVKAGIAGALPKSPFRTGSIMSTHYTPDGRLMAQVKPSEESQKRDREDKADAQAAVLGLILAIIGTVAWGYGDLLNIPFRYGAAAPPAVCPPLKVAPPASSLLGIRRPKARSAHV